VTRAVAVSAPLKTVKFTKYQARRRRRRRRSQQSQERLLANASARRASATTSSWWTTAPQRSRVWRRSRRVACARAPAC